MMDWLEPWSVIEGIRPYIQPMPVFVVNLKPGAAEYTEPFANLLCRIKTMNDLVKKDAKALSEARQKYASATLKARYAELGRVLKNVRPDKAVMGLFSR